MKYSPSTGGFYTAEIHGDNIPADAIDITDAQHAALLAGQAQGKRIVADESGRPVLVDPPVPSHADLVAQALEEARARRQPIITVLDGLQVSAVVAGNTALATAIEASKQGLRDITTLDLSACLTYEDMRRAFMTRYADLVAAAPPEVLIAFDGALA